MPDHSENSYLEYDEVIRSGTYSSQDIRSAIYASPCEYGHLVLVSRIHLSGFIRVSRSIYVMG